MSTPASEHPVVWVIRGGGSGEFEDLARELRIAVIDFRVGDLSAATTLEAVRAQVKAAHPTAPSGRIRSFTGQLTSFRVRMTEGDFVAMPLKKNPGQLAVGRVAGPYQFSLVESERLHTRRVEWQTEPLARGKFGDDIIASLSVPPTVVQVRAPNAAQRMRAVLRGDPDPGAGDPTADATDDQVSEHSMPELVLSTDPEELILDHIRQLFPEHRFAELVDAVLAADGYVTFRSPPGPDAGVDILGGRGPLGFDSPKLCVQVKATEQPVGTPDLDRLAGAMEKHAANRGLFVSWSGFTKPANDEARRSYFRMRLSSGRDLLYEIFRLYDRVPADIRAKIPLKQVWTLVGDDDQ